MPINFERATYEQSGMGRLRAHTQPNSLKDIQNAQICF